MGNRINSREGFISDNLVDIGKRLQINHELKTTGGTAVVGDAPEEVRLSSRRPMVEKTEAERLFRELRDRIGRDAAATAAELELMDLHRRELELFRDFLAGAAEELEQLNVSSPDALRRIENIRYRCFNASGRAQAFFNSGGNASGVNSPVDFEHKPFGVLVWEALPLALAVMMGALLVGAAVIYSLC